MSRRSLTTAALLIAALLAAFLWWPREDPAPPAIDHEVARADERTPAPEVAEANHRATPTEREEVAPPLANANPRILRVRVRGLHPELPWTEAITMELDDRQKPYNEDFVAREALDEQARCRFVLPDWWQPERRVRLQLRARNDGYRELYFRDKDTIDTSREIVLDARPISLIRGRVTDVRGNPIQHARISAFIMTHGQPAGSVESDISTDADGNYVLTAPPDLPLLLVATPMKPPIMRWRRINGANDSGEMRDDLLPASHQLRAIANEPRTSIDFVLQDAAQIRGTVQNADGTPAANAIVRCSPLGGQRHQLSHVAELVWHAGQPPTVASGATTDGDGKYSLGCAPGARVELFVSHAHELRTVGKPPRKAAIAPHTVDFTLPAPTVLQAFKDGEIAERSRIHIRGESGYRTNKAGNARVLVYERTPVRAELGDERSPWVTVTSLDHGRTVPLPLADDQTLVEIEFEGEFPVRNVAMHWTDDRGISGTEWLQRGDNSGPFRLHLPPGSYSLRATASHGERNGTFLLPVERKLVLSSATERLTLPARFGGTFSLTVRDQRNAPYSGTCDVFGPGGKPLRARFTKDNDANVFVAGRAGRFEKILPPGDYRLFVKVDGHPTKEHALQITARECADVVVEL